MDKIYAALLAPVTRLLTSATSGFALLYWGLGLIAFHVGHPGPLPGCLSGGRGYCDLFVTTDPRSWAARAVLLLGVLIVALGVFGHADLGTRLLLGAYWPPWPILLRIQSLARRRAIKRCYGSLEIHPNEDRRPPPAYSYRTVRVLQYPHGTPVHTTPPNELDVPLATTRLGNIFAGTCQLIEDQHGLRMRSCWKQLLAVLPADARARIDRSSESVLYAVDTFILCCLSVGWTGWLPGWSRMLGIVVLLACAWLAYHVVCERAVDYCDELRKALQLHRFKLYDVLGLARPPSTLCEATYGRRLSDHLDGDDSTDDPFRHPRDPD